MNESKLFDDRFFASFKLVNVQIFVLSPIITNRSKYPGTRP